MRRFFRTPKGLLTIVLAILTAIAAPGEGLARVWPGLTSAILVAMLIDAPILRMRGRAWVFPSGALLTGWIVALVLSAQEPWYVTAVTSAVGVVSKYLVRTRTANVFNPAALAIVATFYVFDTGQSWWGALPEAAPETSCTWRTVTACSWADSVFISGRSGSAQPSCRCQEGCPSARLR